MNAARRLTELVTQLESISPEHDSPIGLIHPYWARKPLNVISSIIEVLSEHGDTVADPFVGSGTVAIAALSLGRHAVASDINPLATLIVQTLVNLGNEPTPILRRLREIVEGTKEKALAWYEIDHPYYVERERFAVAGDYAWGAFELEPTEYVLKRYENGRLKGRKVVRPSEVSYRRSPDERFIRSPIDFAVLDLVYNSRIAIPEGATISHFFTERNAAFINLFIATIDTLDPSDTVRPVLQTFLSSLLPLLRLSDKKATSQWPYWRPKSALTSRNPLVALDLRLSAFEEAARWASEHLGHVSVFEDSTFYRQTDDLGLLLQTIPAQCVFDMGIRPASAALVLTDPPYSDQAPYLEYSEMSNRILGLNQDRLWSREIVKTDAPSRTDDAAAYARRIRVGLAHCCDLVRPEGFLVLFYQDRLLAHWAAIWKAITEQGLIVWDVVAIPKQRRSMKTVTSPGRTLDGDLLVLCYKSGEREPASSANLRAHHKEQVDLDTIIQAIPPDCSYFERYAQFIRLILVQGCVDQVARQIQDVMEIM